MSSVTLEQVLADIQAAANVKPELEEGEFLLKDLAEQAGVSRAAMKQWCMEAQKQGAGRFRETRQGNAWKPTVNKG